ncbi:hypothetical protein KAFR_0H03610 [Kazachstania africana CBS 2517]|uniref:Uncharacterized protein n=1 Tax=Kazachstania africana (strain ATCC 22294 / BCRC 22015 / CBS 2517 / CECT 1963 / NBRC 1671 / NRRL Y-8276) TaxID=1071382 RepID=H2AYJ4_KAZAF|nr:hypothetical protein KAFR_0H03610 [Kazachstania africana CBS 2517]CCF59771.1 hypothetical protein KAFR_0H03610 [Kazachstania africana CBS 2517]
MDPKDTQNILKEHNVPVVDVDWVIRSKVKDKEKSERKDGESKGTGDNGGNLFKDSYLESESLSEVKKTSSNEDIETTEIDSSHVIDSRADDLPPAGLQLRRTQSESIADTGNYRMRSGSVDSRSEKKSGFLRSLFSRKRSQSQSQPTSRTQTPPPSLTVDTKTKRSASIATPSKNSRLAEESNTQRGERALPGQENTRSQNLARSKEESVHHHYHHHHHRDSYSGGESCQVSENNKFGNTKEDKRLMEFLKYYKSKNYSVSAFKDTASSSTKRALFSIVDDNNEGYENIYSKENSSKKFDVKGRPIPPHPDTSKLPSAIKASTNNISTDTSNNRSNTTLDSESSATPLSANYNSNKFGAFLKKVTSYGNSNVNVPDSTAVATNVTKNPSKSNLKNDSKLFDPAKASAVPGLEDMGTLKHVSFATNTYFNDPPQQICSKHPRKGEVEVKSNGSVIIHKLSPEEKRKIMEESSTGIVVGGSGQLKLLSPNLSLCSLKKKEEGRPQQNNDTEGKKNDVVLDSQTRNIRVAAAEAAAEARAKDSPGINEDDVKVSKTASHLTIDKPMITRRSSSNTLLSTMPSSASLPSMSSTSDDEMIPPPNIKIPHDVVYTRCCHLREILPIPATLKQLTPGSTDPIPLLQLRNPRPSMVEIWSFSDFIRVSPISCISLDGVSLSVEMLKTILSALANKANFEKLSLRNTPLDEEGWKLLAYFISHSKALNALDLTMVPQIKTNVQKPSKSSLRNKNNITRMECNLDNRSDMNWNLMAGAITFKGGVEELVLSGAKMTVSQFKIFIEVACVKTTRLGLAYNDLTLEQCEILAKWLVNSNVIGLDIGFNDLSGKLEAFREAVWNKIYKEGKKNVFRYLSLNGTNLQVNENDTSKTNDVLKLISTLSYAEDLRFLDLSNNPKMFPHCLSTLMNTLPVFVSLLRLHLDYNGMSSTDVVTLAEILPLCTKLKYFSMLGTPLDLAASKAMAEVMKKNSSLITLDIDYIYVPEKIKDQISLYTMNNIQNELTRVKENDTQKPDFINNADAKKRKDAAYNLKKQLVMLLTEDLDNVDREEYNQTVKKFIIRLSIAREKITKVVQDLFSLRLQGELNFEGKETLIRLCVIDASLEKGTRLLKERTDHKDSMEIMNEPRSPDGTAQREAILEFSSFGRTGHTALLPFSSAQIEKTSNDAEDAVPLTESPEPEHLKPSVPNEETGEEHHDSLPNTVSQEERDALGRAAESMDSDQIKEFLLRSDVASVINAIDELHRQGYHLHHIFKRQGGNCPEKNCLNVSDSSSADFEGLHQSKTEESQPVEKLGDVAVLNSKDYKNTWTLKKRKPSAQHMTKCWISWNAREYLNSMKIHKL